MNDFNWFLGVLVTLGASIVAYWYHMKDLPVRDITDYKPLEPTKTPEVPQSTITESTPVVKPPTAPQELLWDTPQHSFHSTRVICDEAGLWCDDKNTLCACIYQESAFNNAAINHNEGSTDYGICQVNDYWHIGKGKTFPSVEYVINNPEKIVRWMVSKYGTEEFGMWVSYTSGAYKKWLLPSSPMWRLKVT